MTSPSVIGIIGGGLASFALARFLQGRGIVTVCFERDADHQLASGNVAQGYAVGLTPETLDFLQPLCARSLTVAGNEHSSFTICAADGSQLVKFDGQPARGWFVHRPELRALLREGVDVTFEKELQRYEERPDGVIAHFTDGSSAGLFALLVGCDGARSAVRAQLQPESKHEDLGVTIIAGALPFDAVPPPMKTMVRDGLARVLAADGMSFMALQYVEGNGGEHSLQ